MAGDAWLSRYEACKRLGQNVMEAVSERNQIRRQGGNPARESATASSQLKQYSSTLAVLREDLLKSSRSVGSSEADRRQKMLDELNSREKQLKEAIRDDGGSASAPGISLFGGGRQGYQRFQNESDEPEDARAMGVNDLRDRQKVVMKEQDDGLDALSHVIAQQKNMALGIGDEIESQNELIDGITNHAESTQSRILRETRHVSIVDRKSNTCWYWVVIIFLFIAIVVIAVVPFGNKP